jgi:hypothetical protein
MFTPFFNFFKRIRYSLLVHKYDILAEECLDQLLDLDPCDLTRFDVEEDFKKYFDLARKYEKMSYN